MTYYAITLRRAERPGRRSNMTCQHPKERVDRTSDQTRFPDSTHSALHTELSTFICLFPTLQALVLSQNYAVSSTGDAKSSQMCFWLSTSSPSRRQLFTHADSVKDTHDWAVVYGNSLVST